MLVKVWKLRRMKMVLLVMEWKIVLNLMDLYWQWVSWEKEQVGELLQELASISTSHPKGKGGLFGGLFS